jgi:hypothetical protein
VRHVGDLTELSIANGIEELCNGCFSSQLDVPVVRFESPSRPRRFGRVGPTVGEGLPFQRVLDCFRVAAAIVVMHFCASNRRLDCRVSILREEAFALCLELTSIGIRASRDRIGHRFEGRWSGIVVVHFWLSDCHQIAGFRTGKWCFDQCWGISAARVEANCTLSVIEDCSLCGCRALKTV